MSVYPPGHALENEAASIKAAIDTIVQATLIVPDGAGLHTSYVPLLAESDEPPVRTLIGHVHTANPQAVHLDGGRAHAVFHGPHAYVSPAAYEKRSVPTWDYVNVEAVGVLERIDDEAGRRNLLERLARHMEPGSDGWRPEDEPELVASLLPQMTGFRLHVESIRGRFKVSRNKGPADRSAVAEVMRRDNPAHFRGLIDELYDELNDPGGSDEEDDIRE